jgi:hypothetical protein
MSSMTRSRSKPSSIGSTPPAVDIFVFGRDLDNWPRSWMGIEEDLVAGSALLPHFRAFIEHLV